MLTLLYSCQVKLRCLIKGVFLVKNKLYEIVQIFDEVKIRREKLEILRVSHHVFVLTANIFCIIARFTFYKVFMRVLNNNKQAQQLMEKQSRKS